MPVQPFRIQLGRATRRRVFIGLSAVNVALSVTTALFILIWARFETLSPAMQWFTRHILVQGHLATENVVAAWYSSMVLLTIALAAGLAWAIDGRERAGRLRHGWLVFAAIFCLLSLDEIGSLHERVGMVPLISTKALGWAYLLAAPMLAVGAFMLAFAWFHLRRVPSVFPLTAAGVGMFLMNPVLESIEMAMIHGAGAVQGTWQRTLHDVLLVAEEGGLELFGMLCFLAAISLYAAGRAGDVVNWLVARRTALRAARLATILLAVGVFVSEWVVGQLPPGDTGQARNWFPAAAWMLVAFTALAQGSPSRRARYALATGAIAISAIMGAYLYGYSEWLTSKASWFTPSGGVIAAGLALEIMLGAYLFRRSPMSSMASPTFRRPRPNPS